MEFRIYKPIPFCVPRSVSLRNTPLETWSWRGKYRRYLAELRPEAKQLQVRVALSVQMMGYGATPTSLVV